jgi:hypothetical protein
VSNITVYRDGVRDFVKQSRKAIDVWGFVETHVEEEDTIDAWAHLDGAGFCSYWAPSRPTGRGGSSGGAVLITDPSRVISTHLAAIEGEAKLPTEGPFQDALPIWVEVNGGGFFVTPVYLTCGIGLHGENDEKLKRWAALVKTFPGP